MQYGYYELLHFIAFVGFGFLGHKANQKDKSEQVFVYVALALLFQSFYKIALGREIWNMVDVIVGTCLLASILFKNRN